MKSVNQYVMKDSGVQWIGQVPEHWEVCKLSYCFNQIGSGTTPKYSEEVRGEEGVAWIQSGDLNDAVLKSTKHLLPKEVVSQYSVLKIYKQPFIAVAMYGASIGKTSLSLIDACTNQACCVLADSKGDLQYSFYVMLALKDLFVYLGIGGGQPNISQTIIKQQCIPLPPLSEQRAIANWLDAKCADIDAAIELQQRMIDKLKAYKTAVIHQAVTKGLDKNANLKDSGVQWIGEIPKHWEVCKIKNKFMIISGGTPKSDVESYWNGDVVWVTPADYNTEDKVIVKGKRNITEEGLKNSSATILPKNSIIFSKRAPIGLVAINAVPLATNQGCLGCIPKLNVDTIYSYFLLSSFQKQFELLGSGTTFKEISLSSFSSFVIPLPPLTEQRAIADWLDAKCADIDATIALKEQKQEKLKAYKKTIIFEYVTGKKQVANINKQL